MKIYLLILASILCFNTNAGITDIYDIQPVESRYYYPSRPAYIYVFFGNFYDHDIHVTYRSKLSNSLWLNGMPYKTSKIHKAARKKLQELVDTGVFPPGTYMWATWIEGHHWPPPRYYMYVYKHKPKKQKDALLEF